jgi:hypothetical protein
MTAVLAVDGSPEGGDEAGQPAPLDEIVSALI